MSFRFTRKEKVALLWVLQHLLNSLHFVERLIHIFYSLGLFSETCTHFPACPLLNFLPVLAEVLIFHGDIFFFCFTQHLLLTNLLEVSAEQNRCTCSSLCTHGTHLLPASSPYPLLASLHFTHLWGQLHAASHPSAATHTHSAKPHSSLSAPASLMFLTVPQCPESTGLQCSGFL